MGLRGQEPGRLSSKLLVIALGLGASGLLAACAAGGSGASGASGPGSTVVTATTIEPVVVPVVVDARSGVHVDTLAELVAASDTVVIARVVATDRGPVVESAGGGQPIVTRQVHLEVDQVLAGEDVPDQIVVAEDGWLTDGTPVSVGGLAPSAVGDLGIWFLVAGDDAQGSSWVLVGEQGRYLSDPADETKFLPVGVDDPLVATLSSQDPIILRHQIQEAAIAGQAATRGR